MAKRSQCPISNVLDHLGDKWSLLILRDLLFFNKNTYSELQTSEEKIATNILSNRLDSLEKNGLLIKRADKRDKRKKVYSLTQAGIDTLPILLEMIIWSSKHAQGVALPEELISEYRKDRAGVIAKLITRINVYP